MSNKNFNRDGNHTRKNEQEYVTNNSRGKKNNKRTTGKTRNSKEASPMSDKRAGYGGNDVSWYTRNAELTESAARIPFPYVPGKELSLGEAIVSSDLGWMDTADLREATSFKQNYPGIMALGFFPSVGRSTEVSSPINVSAREVYARIRSKYSGSLEADAPDIMMYLLAIDSLYMILEDMKRAYYLINSVTPYNRLYPKAVIRALGWDYDDLLANRTKFYQNIVELGALLKKFRVPDNMDLYKRHQFMCANVYADSPIAKSQHYVFRPDGFYQLDTTDTMTSLTMKSWHDAVYLTVATSFSKFKAALDILMSWDTGYTITGYLERAYENETFLIPSPVIEDAVLVPVYNSEILLQINNANVVPIVVETLDITQDPARDNVLLSTPQLSMDRTMEDDSWILGPVLHRSAVINMPTSDNPSSADIIISTRLQTVAADVPYDDVEGIAYASCGTEIIHELELFNDVDGSPVPWIVSGTTSVGSKYIGDADEGSSLVSAAFPSAIVRTVGLISGFNYHPIFLVTRYGREETTYNEVGESLIFGNIDNFTTVESKDLENLHRMCIYSEFNAFR